MFAIVTVKVADLVSPTGGGCIPLDAEVLKDLICSAIIDEGFEDVEVHVTVVPEEEGILPDDVKDAILGACYKGMIVIEADSTPEERQTNMEQVHRALYGKGGK